MIVSKGTAQRKLVFFLLDIEAISIDTAALFLMLSETKSGTFDEIRTDIVDYFVRTQ